MWSMFDGEPRPSSGTATLRTVPIAIPDPRRRAAAGVDRAPAPRTVPIAFPGHGGRGSAKFTRVPPVYCNTLTYGCFIDNMHALQFTVIEFLMHCTGPGGDFPMHCITAPVDFRYWGNPLFRGGPVGIVPGRRWLCRPNTIAQRLCHPAGRFSGDLGFASSQGASGARDTT